MADVEYNRRGEIVHTEGGMSGAQADAAKSEYDRKYGKSPLGSAAASEAARRKNAKEEDDPDKMSPLQRAAYMAKKRREAMKEN